MLVFIKGILIFIFLISARVIYRIITEEDYSQKKMRNLLFVMIIVFLICPTIHICINIITGSNLMYILSFSILIIAILFSNIENSIPKKTSKFLKIIVGIFCVLIVAVIAIYVQYYHIDILKTS